MFAGSLRHRKKQWHANHSSLDEMADSLKNPKGKTRDILENKMMLLALIAALRRALEAVEHNNKPISSVTQSAIEQEVARDFFCNQTSMLAKRGNKVLIVTQFW